MYIEHINEDYKNLSTWEKNPDSLVATFVKYRNMDKFPLLSGIEQYQDTYFNTAQIVILAKELKNFKMEFQEDTKREIDSLIEFAKKIGIHEYLRFVGD